MEIGASFVAGATPKSTLIYELESAKYPGMCLDANGSGSTAGHNGDKVQLWSCFDDQTNHQNQWWGFYSDASVASHWDGGGKVLDANGSGSTAGQNGDKIQIWDSLGGANQHWFGR